MTIGVFVAAAFAVCWLVLVLLGLGLGARAGRADREVERAALEAAREERRHLRLVR